MTQLTIVTESKSVEDIVRRGIKRTLACELTDPEFTQIARVRATKELELRQLERDLAKEKEKRKEQIDELAEEVAKMGRELATGQQERTVPCNEVFRSVLEDRGVETGYIFTIRQDTLGEVERRPATPSEMQRYLPGTEPPAMTGTGTEPKSVLDKARARQATEEQRGEPAADPDEDDLPELGPEDLGDQAPPTDNVPEADEPGADEDEPPETSRIDLPRGAVEKSSGFAVDDIVTWTSQAGGREMKKTGKVDAVIPRGKTPRTVDERYKKFATARQHESYVVDVDGELYWPVVSKLKAKGKR